MLRFFKELTQDSAVVFLGALLGLILWVGWCAPRPTAAALEISPTSEHPYTFEQVIEAIEKEREDSIAALAIRYDLTDTLATMIHDIAIAEGISGDLGARLVLVESGAQPNVVSWAGAVGYTQVMPRTAYELMPHLAYRDLFDPATNLHLGFRYLASLLDTYDLEHALLAYNRGPRRVENLLAAGRDPRNGYALAVCRGPCAIN